jgi:hypothetical protein
MTESEAKNMLALVNVAMDLPGGCKLETLSVLAREIADHLTEEVMVAEPAFNPEDVEAADKAFQEALDDKARLDWMDSDEACWTVRHWNDGVLHQHEENTIRDAIDFCMTTKTEEQ